jgi:hypothetical protein
LHSNPWTDLPPKWGKIWPQSQAADYLEGYDLSEAMSFLYAMRIIYDPAEAIWQELGHYYYTGRLEFHDFTAELAKRLPHSWEQGLSEYAKVLYFQVGRGLGIVANIIVVSLNTSM